MSTGLPGELVSPEKGDPDGMPSVGSMAATTLPLALDKELGSPWRPQGRHGFSLAPDDKFVHKLRQERLDMTKKSGGKPPSPRDSGKAPSSIAGKALSNGGKLSKAETVKLAASVLSQNQKP